MSTGRRFAVAIAISTLLASLISTPVQAADPNPPFIPAAADWLSTVNYYRAMAGVGAVVEDPALSPGAYNHSCYMLLNDITHDELPGAPGYTSSGDAAGNASNVAVSSATGLTNRSFVELWITAPFHAIGILRPNLERAGYGQCENPNTARWRSGATLNVLSGLGPQQGLANPILFPGNGTVTSLTNFIAESPNPVEMCGWGNTGAGLPVIAMMPEGFNSNPTTTMTGPDGPVTTCVLSANNTSGTARDILQGNNAVVVMPRSKLSPGVYSVTVSTSARTVSWSFTSLGMMLCFVPPWIEPTVTTTGSSGSVSRLTMVCRSRMMRAESTMGSMVMCGAAPCPPLPFTRMSTVSEFAIASPSLKPSVPAACCGSECSASAKSGFGNFVYSPASSIFFAPATISSAGWPMNTTVPLHLSFIAARTRAVPTHDAMWMSCPHACITPTSTPSRFFTFTLLA